MRDSNATTYAQFHGLPAASTRHSRTRPTNSEYSTLVEVVGVLAGVVVLVVGVTMVNRRMLAKLAEDMTETDPSVEMSLLAVENPTFDEGEADFEQSSRAQSAGRHYARPPILNAVSQPPVNPVHLTDQVDEADQVFFINGDTLERRGGEHLLSPVSDILLILGDL